MGEEEGSGHGEELKEFEIGSIALRYKPHFRSAIHPLKTPFIAIVAVNFLSVAV